MKIKVEGFDIEVQEEFLLRLFVLHGEQLERSSAAYDASQNGRLSMLLQLVGPTLMKWISGTAGEPSPEAAAAWKADLDRIYNDVEATSPEGDAAAGDEDDEGDGVPDEPLVTPAPAGG